MTVFRLYEDGELREMSMRDDSESAYGLCQCSECVELRRSGRVFFPPSPEANIETLRRWWRGREEVFNHGRKFGEPKGGKRMTKDQAIERVWFAGGAAGNDWEGARVFVNCLAALGLLKLDDAMPESALDRAMRGEAPKSAVAEAAGALVDMPYVGADQTMDKISLGLASTIILRLVAKGFRISRE